MIYQAKIVIYHFYNIWMIYPVTDISMIYQPTIYYFYKDISAWYMISQIYMIYLCMKFYHWYVKLDIILFTEIYQENWWYITKYHHDISISHINFLIYHDISGFSVDISWYVGDISSIWANLVHMSDISRYIVNFTNIFW